MRLAVILGSGLGEIVEKFSQNKLLSPSSIGVHNRKVYVVSNAGFDILMFRGRKHFYEGFDVKSIISDMKLAEEYGVKFMLITNAAGGINENYKISDLMLINSHINFNQKLLFKKTTSLYEDILSDKFHNVCRKAKVRCHDGVYGCVQGPAYETVSEVKILKKYGVDAVGMSTIPDLHGAVQIGLQTIGVSVITNLLKGDISSYSAHSEILSSAQKATDILYSVIIELANELN
jgi:purine-nucleoside phosphorylase